MEPSTFSYTPGSTWTLKSGVKGLVILKTSHSGFVGFKRDAWTTLPETTDRLFGTRSHPSLGPTPSQYRTTPKPAPKLLRSLLTTFANHDSLSVQQTLFQMAEDALALEPALSAIELTMPNRHNLLVDLSPFGQINANEIFVPTDEPHGQIHARVVR